jgi:hypothetical protein
MVLQRAAVAGVAPGIVLRGTAGSPSPVVSFHVDAPYLDLSGQGVPYRPPAGARGGEAIARLTETELHSLLLI